MRKKIYLQIIKAINNAEIGIQHINLWNNNVEDLEKSSGFALPALFVEFEPIQWKQRGMGCKTATISLKLHIVISSIADPADGSIFQFDALQVFDMIDDLVDTASGVAGEGFNRLVHVGSSTDHNHAEVQHHIESFSCEVTDNTVMNRRKYITVENINVSPQKRPTPD